ncbi:M20/M25/M40 family metallo-hydrolase [Alteribacter aurantiacus]|uniref:M20/M25/M40 family metallo-hydrolase n=1 Tax=Alteribacter aurantiacus TaxID=254410 RepID=UPI0004261F00|nr:M20/M25/M40 family metallo-hydrolase [Alteribacter aurantiacus]
MDRVRIKKAISTISNHDKVKRALNELKEIRELTLREQIAITEIEAPTFEEAKRGEYFANMLKEAGVQDISTDNHGNVFGVRKGSKTNSPRLVVCAHLDTVFPAGTSVKAIKKDGKIFAPGIADDGRGLAVVLTLARIMDQLEISTIGDVMIGATVGEEGLGDLYGVKGLFKDRDDIDGFISIEPGSPQRIIFSGTGSRRHRVTFTGPGGHSFGDFGTPSAIHALGRAVSEIADIIVPSEPKTTYNVGEIKGGTTVNTIAEQASMIIDLRSTDQTVLTSLEKDVMAVIDKAARIESNRGGDGTISVSKELVGDRPAGSQEESDLIVQVAGECVKQIGLEPLFSAPISTDSNVPISLGVPSLTLGGGGGFGGAHTVNEFFDPTDDFLGPRQILLTVLALSGVDKVSEPLLEKRT